MIITIYGKMYDANDILIDLTNGDLIEIIPFFIKGYEEYQFMNRDGVVIIFRESRNDLSKKCNRKELYGDGWQGHPLAKPRTCSSSKY